MEITLFLKELLMWVNKGELTTLNSRHLAAGGSGGGGRVFHLAKNPKFTSKIAVGKLLLCDSKMMRNYAKGKEQE